MGTTTKEGLKASLDRESGSFPGQSSDPGEPDQSGLYAPRGARNVRVTGRDDLFPLLVLGVAISTPPGTTKRRLLFFVVLIGWRFHR